VTILVVLIPAVVAAGLAVLATVLYGTGGLWLVHRIVTPRHAQPRQAISATTPGAASAPEAHTEPPEEVRRPRRAVGAHQLR
jgi:hypothetical protein